MGKGTHKFFFCLQFLFQLFHIFGKCFRHPVKIPGQLSQFIPAHLFCPVIIIPRRHPFRCLCQKVYRFRQKRGNQMHDDSSHKEHQKCHPAIERKSHSPLRKYIRHIPHRLQIENSVQGIYIRPRMHIIFFP